MIEKCTGICELLDQIPPYNVNFVFVCSYYSDKQTSLDILSRLGNFTSLSGYDHYLIDLDTQLAEYLKTLNAVVFDHCQTEIFIFLSDAFCQTGTYVDLPLLSKIPNMQTVYLCSLSILKDKAIDHLTEQQVQELHHFIRNEVEEAVPLKLF